MPVESMRLEGEAVYEVVEHQGELVWQGVRSGEPKGNDRLRVGRVVGGMHADQHPVGTRIRVKTVTTAKIEKPKRTK